MLRAASFDEVELHRSDRDSYMLHPLERPCELIYDSMTSVTSCGYDSRTAICGQPIVLAA
jgi:hypothetical protein